MAVQSSWKIILSFLRKKENLQEIINDFFTTRSSSDFHDEHTFFEIVNFLYSEVLKNCSVWRKIDARHCNSNQYVVFVKLEFLAC